MKFIEKLVETLDLFKRSWAELDDVSRRRIIQAVAFPLALTAVALAYGVLLALGTDPLKPVKDAGYGLYFTVGFIAFFMVGTYGLIYRAHHAIRDRYLKIMYPKSKNPVRRHWDGDQGWILALALIGLLGLPANILGLIVTAFMGSFQISSILAPIGWAVMGFMFAPRCCHLFILMDE